MDPKYVRQSDYDEAWTTACNGADFNLKRLISEADSAHEQAKDIRNVLTKFRDTTEANVLPKITILVQKYDKGPVNNPKVQNKPYLTYLNEDMEKYRKETKATLEKYERTYSQWKGATGLAVGVGVTIGWIPVFGWVPLGFLAANAEDLRVAWKKLENSYNEMVKRDKDEATLVKFVQWLVRQFDGPLDKINAAIAAVGVLSTMFQAQSLAYSHIRDSLQFMNQTITEQDANNRQWSIQQSLDETVAQIEALEIAGAGFVEAILTQDMNVLGK